MYQPGVSDLAETEVQIIEVRQSLQVSDPGVGDVGLGKGQLLNLLKYIPVRCASVASVIFLPPSISFYQANPGTLPGVYFRESSMTSAPVFIKALTPRCRLCSTSSCVSSVVLPLEDDP